MLNLLLLESEGYEIDECKWLKNNIVETITFSYDQFSYSAGPKAHHFLEPDPTFYMFRLTLENGTFLHSTRKVIPPYEIYGAPPVDNSLIIYPNPVLSGSYFTIEGTIEGSPVYVYNHFGICVNSTIATGSTISLALELPMGIYFLRSENKTGKLIIVR